MVLRETMIIKQISVNIQAADKAREEKRKADYEYQKAEKEYDIYVLNGASTFSSGDILAGVLKDQPNVTTIGNNTGGEGYSGHPMDFYLPESKFPVTYSFSVSVNHPDDNYLGTTADVFVANGWDNWMKRREILDDPNFDGNIKSFENRLKWDEVMIEAVRLMDSKK